MALSRRQFTRVASLAAGTLLTGARDASAQDEAPRPSPDVVRALKPLPGAPPGIAADERRARIEKARRLTVESFTEPSPAIDQPFA